MLGILAQYARILTSHKEQKSWGQLMWSKERDMKRRTGLDD